MYFDEYYLNKSFKASDSFELFCRTEGLDSDYVKAYAALKEERLEDEAKSKKSKISRRSIKTLKSMFSQ